MKFVAGILVHHKGQVNSFSLNEFGQRNLEKSGCLHLLSTLTLWGLRQQLSSAHSGRNAPRACRGKLFSWAIYFLIVSSTIFIQTEKARMKKNREADKICDIRQFVVVFKWETLHGNTSALRVLRVYFTIKFTDCSRSGNNICLVA